MDHASAVNGLSTLIASISNTAGNMIDNHTRMTDKALPITNLSETVGVQLSIDKMFCYHIITKYIKIRNDILVKKGPGGGIITREVFDRLKKNKDDAEAAE